jgi:imidazolonepropionase-like amidohydrolase
MTSTLILKGMTLIDGTGRPPQEHVILAIRNGCVLYVGDAAGWIVAPDEPATVLDLTGHFILPGLIVMSISLVMVRQMVGYVGILAGPRC